MNTFTTHGFVSGLERLEKMFPGTKQVEKVQSGNWNSCMYDRSELQGNVAIWR